jgi:hypothetical protein
MKYILLTILAVFLLAGDTLAQRKSLPRFEDFPVREKFIGKLAPVKLHSPRARNFRTTLKRQVQTGPNFAGHYIIATWGCGTFMCSGFAIIDARNGNVYFPPKIEHVTLAYLDQEEQEPIKFRKDSRLLILTGEVTFDDGSIKIGKYFYLWQNNKLKLIQFIEKMLTMKPQPNNSFNRSANKIAFIRKIEDLIY